MFNRDQATSTGMIQTCLLPTRAWSWQWRIQYFPTYYFALFSPETSWKWKKCEPRLAEGCVIYGFFVIMVHGVFSIGQNYSNITLVLFFSAVEEKSNKYFLFNFKPTDLTSSCISSESTRLYVGLLVYVQITILFYFYTCIMEKSFVLEKNPLQSSCDDEEEMVPHLPGTFRLHFAHRAGTIPHMHTRDHNTCCNVQYLCPD